MKLISKLSIPVFPEEKEKRFQETYARENLVPARIIQSQIGLIFFLAGYLDLVLLGELATLMVFLRYAVFGPMIIALIVFTFTPWFVSRMQGTFCAGVTVVSCYVALFAFLNEGMIAMLYFSGAILAVFVSFIYVPMFFRYALGMSVVFLVLCLSGLIFNESLPFEIVQALAILLIGSTALALVACYTNERHARLGFHYRELLNREKHSLEEDNVQLKNLANHDGLTGIANRRAFDERLNEEWQRAGRSESELAILLMDVDYFKPFNDFYGHQIGDVCLTRIAEALDKTVGRVGDFVARYGGEEFVIILPNADLNQAVEFADKVREAVTALEIPHEKSNASPYVSLSIGVASTVPGKHDYDEAEFLLRDADRALYQAKNDGRNRSVGFRLSLDK